MIPIEKVKEGMLVYSQNVVNGEKDYKTVISTTSHLVYEVVQIKTELEVLVTTESHPFWVGSQGWKNAGDIVKGDELKLEDGNSASVIDIEVIKLEKPIRVYNYVIGLDGQEGQYEEYEKDILTLKKIPEKIVYTKLNYENGDLQQSEELYDFSDEDKDIFEELLKEKTLFE